MKPKSLHPADAADRAAIPEATSFIASIFLGTGRFAKSETATIEAARATAEHFAAHYRNGRKPLVYAILPDGRQVLVPDDYQPNSRRTNPWPRARVPYDLVVVSGSDAVDAARAAIRSIPVVGIGSACSTCPS
jgi:hypothetical protein